MKAVDFYKLPRAIQDRFVGSVMSGFPPAPLLAQKGGTPQKFIWLGLTGGCLVALVVVSRLGYGSLESGMSLQSVKILPVYAGLVFGAAFGLVMAFSRFVREQALPYTSGVYLFPACLIDARSDQFRVFETKDLASVDLAGAAVKVSFMGGTNFTFAVTNPAAAPEIVQEVQAARDRAMHAKATEDPKELVAVDPLHNPRFSSPVGPRDSYQMRLPPWGKLSPVVAAAVAILFGPAIWLLRNNGSDKTMYARATQADDTLAYQAYLDRGSKFHDDVANVLLPRAELRDAVKAGTVEALLAYKASHPNSQIGAEVQQSIRSAMLGELEKAKAVGTLGALEDFAKKFPDHGVGPELAAAEHAVYQRELDAYEKRAPNKDKDKAAQAFVERLFAYAEKHGPAVEIRFKNKKSESMGRADQYVAKTPSFMGTASYPSNYFDDKHSLKRDGILGAVLAQKLDAGISPELLDVKMGAPVSPDADGLPDVKVPTLFVSQSAEWSGHSYVSQRPRGSYVGITFQFDAVWVIPGDAKPFKYKTDIFKHAALGVLKDVEPMPMPGPAEEMVYESMAEEAFDQFGKKLLAFFLPPDKSPDK